ncbi:hypothetical protein ARTHRO8AJ_340025 [Arthrobacter sp. 8AJ]|nr:hypothetical protein ARTHRO8AJ_340025 [Arthrobacter sp. 8AJ]
MLAGGGCGQQRGVIVDVHHGRAGCLLGKPAGFEADYALAETAIVNDCFRELDFGTLQESHLRFFFTEVQPHQPGQHLSTGPAPGHRSRPTGRRLQSTKPFPGITTEDRECVMRLILLFSFSFEEGGPFRMERAAPKPD